MTYNLCLLLDKGSHSLTTVPFPAFGKKSDIVYFCSLNFQNLCQEETLYDS